MKAHITATDIADTLLYEDTLRTLLKAGKIAEDKYRETAISPGIRAKSWRPFCRGLHTGGYNEGFSYTEDTTKFPDDGIPHLFIHFHPDEQVLIPSGINESGGDLKILMDNKWGIHLKNAGESESYTVRFRKIEGIARYAPREGIGLLLFQLKQLHKSKNEGYPLRVILESLDNDLAQLHFPKQEEVVETMRRHINACHVSLPIQSLKSKDARKGLSESMKTSLVEKLLPFETGIAVTAYDLFSQDPRILETKEERRRHLGLK